jgi:hypothetical protein
VGEGGQLLVDRGAVGFEFAEPVDDPGAQRGDGDTMRLKHAGSVLAN